MGIGEGDLASATTGRPLFSTNRFNEGMVLGSRAAQPDPTLAVTVSAARPNATNPSAAAASESPVMPAMALPTPVKADSITVTPTTVPLAAPTVCLSGSCPAAPHCKASLPNL
ncbi:hypothetical protein D9M71_826150 [compost metagenome]